MAKNIFAFEKPKDSKKTFRRLLSFVKGKALVFIVLSLFLCLVANIFSLMGPKIAGEAINVIATKNIDFSYLFHLVIKMIVVYSLSSLLILLVNMLTTISSRKIAATLREKCFNKLSSLPVSFFDHHLPGDILSRAFYDVDLITTSLQTDFKEIMTSLVSVLGSLFLMVSISPLLSLIVLLTIPFSILYTVHIKKKTKPLYKKRSAEYGNMNGYVEEVYSLIKTIQSFSREKEFEKDFKSVNDSSSSSYKEAESLGMTIGPNTRFINNLSIALIAILGSIFYMKNLVSLGGISSFVLYSRKFSGPINEIANVINEIISALAAAERIFNFLDEDESDKDKKGAVVCKNSNGNLGLNKIYFSYTKDKEILKDISFALHRGETVALVGPTGAGKSTIINLIMRFYKTDKGLITLDNINQEDYTYSSFRSQFALVLQDTWLFNGTVFENIAYGKEDASMDEVISVSKKANIYSYIMRLKDGFNTVISEDGGNISKGQKQLLTIARAMLLNSPLLILDEATSNVDSRTEVLINKSLQELRKNKGSIVIAHRLSTIKNADLILVLKDGSIIEKGRHEELLKMKGFYYSLYNAQYK